MEAGILLSPFLENIVVHIYHLLCDDSILTLVFYIQTISKSSLILFFFWLFKAAPSAYGGSQARGLVGAVAASLCHSHSKVGSELRLRPTLQLTATPDR